MPVGSGLVPQGCSLSGTPGGLRRPRPFLGRDGRGPKHRTRRTAGGSGGRRRPCGAPAGAWQTGRQTLQEEKVQGSPPGWGSSQVSPTLGRGAPEFGGRARGSVPSFPPSSPLHHHHRGRRFWRDCSKTPANGQCLEPGLPFSRSPSIPGPSSFTSLRTRGPWAPPLLGLCPRAWHVGAEVARVPRGGGRGPCTCWTQSAAPILGQGAMPGWLASSHLTTGQGVQPGFAQVTRWGEGVGRPWWLRPGSPHPAPPGAQELWSGRP